MLYVGIYQGSDEVLLYPTERKDWYGVLDVNEVRPGSLAFNIRGSVCFAAQLVSIRPATMADCPRFRIHETSFRLSLNEAHPLAGAHE